MNRTLLSTFVVLLYLAMGTSFTALAAEHEQLDEAAAPALLFEEPITGYSLCAPGAIGSCIEAGITQYSRTMADKGFHLPYQPLSIEHPEPSLGYLPFLYGRVVTDGAPVYGSAEAASQFGPVAYYLEPGFNYISYSYTEVINDVRVYNLATGLWMNAVDVHRVGTPSFQGVEVQPSQVNPFGWVLQGIEAKTTPGYGVLDYNGKTYNRLEMVQIYDSTIVNDVNWLMIGPDEWVEARFMSVVTPGSQPPNGVTGDRWIELNLFEQTIMVYDKNRLVFATVVSSGIDPYWTRPGLFQIYEKLDTTRMTGVFAADRSDYYYLMDVPWTMYYDQARAIHGAYWHTFYGYERSHGCVNLSPGDSKWLYQWADVGDWVFVHDPSGRTPVDPSLYTEGGA